VPLIQLAADRRSPVLARVVHVEQEDGPERVAVAAFQSSV